MYFLPIWSYMIPHPHRFTNTPRPPWLHVLPASLGPSLHSVSPGLQWRDIRQWPRLRPPPRCRPWTCERKKRRLQGWFQRGNPRTKWKIWTFLAGKIIWTSSVNSRWGVFPMFVFDLAEGTLKYLEMSDCGVANEEIQHPTRGFWRQVSNLWAQEIRCIHHSPVGGFGPSFNGDSKLYWWSTGDRRTFPP